MSQVQFKITKEKLFERSLPEHRWSCSKYQPDPPRPKRNWRLKSAQMAGTMSGMDIGKTIK